MSCGRIFCGALAVQNVLPDAIHMEIWLVRKCLISLATRFSIAISWIKAFAYVLLFNNLLNDVPSFGAEPCDWHL